MNATELKKFEDLFRDFSWKHTGSPHGWDWSGKPMRHGETGSIIGPSLHWYDADDAEGNRGAFHYGRATPTEELRDFCIANMLRVDYDSIYFEIITRDDGTADVYAKHNQIIGSRLAATIDASTLPTPRSEDD